MDKLSKGRQKILNANYWGADGNRNFSLRTAPEAMSQVTEFGTLCYHRPTTAAILICVGKATSHADGCRSQGKCSRFGRAGIRTRPASFACDSTHFTLDESETSRWQVAQCYQCCAADEEQSVGGHRCRVLWSPSSSYRTSITANASVGSVAIGIQTTNGADQWRCYRRSPRLHVRRWAAQCAESRANEGRSAFKASSDCAQKRVGSNTFFFRARSPIQPIAGLVAKCIRQVTAGKSWGCTVVMP